MATKRRARTDEAKDQRRAAFLDAALDEFFERGFAAAKMDDIARRAGLSKGAIYLYFDSKEALFEQLVETLAVPKIERMEAIFAAAPSIEMGLKGVAQFFPAMIRGGRLPRLMKVIISDAFTFPDVVQGYRQRVLDRLFVALAGALEQAMMRGEIRRCDPHLLARLVAAPAPLSAIWHVLFGDDPEVEVDLEGLFALHAEIMLRGLRVEEAA